MGKSDLTLKQLVAGKQRWSRADAVLILKTLRASGLTARAFAQREQIDLGRLARWNGKLAGNWLEAAPRLPAKTADTGAQDPVRAMGFCEVRLPPEQADQDAGFELVVGGKHILRVKRHVDADVLIRVVLALGRLEC